MTKSLAHPDGGRLASLLASAGAKARAERRPILVSLSERVSIRNPLDALEAFVRDAASNGRLAEHVTAGRAYWTRARDGFTLAGLGAVATFAPEGPHRFASVDHAWRALLNGAIIDDASDGACGPGPVLMGGFAFEPAGPRSETWHGFAGAHLIVPRLLLSAVGGECWLSISAMVGRDGVPDVALEELATLCRTVLTVPASVLDQAAAFVACEVPIDYSSPISAPAWRALVAAGATAIRAGEMQKVVLAREVHAAAPRELDVFTILRHLRAAQPDCFVFAYWRGEHAFVGASPERLVGLDGRRVQASSLAGSAPRGATPTEDDALASALLASTKDLAEHASVRDALREGLAELCDDVAASDMPSLLTLRHMHHLHTTVRATLRQDGDHSLLDVVARLHPTPAVGGTPRDAALRFIRGHEQLDRGWYAAPIGWVGRHGGEFAVALRSGIVSGHEAMLFAGCGIVADSDPELEFAESLLKLRPMQSALDAAVMGASPGSTRIPAGAEQSR